MYILKHILLLIPTFSTYVLADVLGPTYPAPNDLTSDTSLVRAAWENLTTTLDGYLKSKDSPDSLADVKKVTFSTGLFSINDLDASRLQYHYTSPQVSNATNGTTEVNGDTIYRMASVSKLFTVLVGLLQLTDEEWHRPLSKIIPGLAQYSNGTLSEEDPINNTPWDKITPWSLANQQGGVSRQGLPMADYLYIGPLIGVDPVTAFGMPPLPISVLGPCISEKCSAEDYIESVRVQPPVFAGPWNTPAYSNNGFILLGLALTHLLGNPTPSLYEGLIFKPLNMSSTSAYPSSELSDLARAVILTGFDTVGDFTIPSGGLLSTINDLAKFGSALLNSALLSAEDTREWMKPHSHTASLTASVGAPWEIHRYVLPETEKVIDLYTKSGDSGNYGGNLVLIPEYKAGFSFLDGYEGVSVVDSTIRSAAQNIALDYVANAVVPALEAQAAAEAKRNFVGTYTSDDPDLDSSVTISFNNSNATSVPHSGLTLEKWVSNGTDVLAAYFAGTRPRLLPSIPLGIDAGLVKGQVAFQAGATPQTLTYYDPIAVKAQVQGPFTGQNVNFDWLTFGGTTYGNFGIAEFIFDVDADGKATCVRPAAARKTLKRK